MLSLPSISLSQFTPQIQLMLYDITLLFNHHSSILTHDYHSYVILIIDAFHTHIYAEDDIHYFNWYYQLIQLNLKRLQLTDFVKLRNPTQLQFIQMYYWLTFDTFYDEQNILFTERQRIIFGNQFKRSNLKSELMAVVWHPNNFHKFIHWDPETFDLDI